MRRPPVRDECAVACAACGLTAFGTLRIFLDGRAVRYLKVRSFQCGRAYRPRSPSSWRPRSAIGGSRALPRRIHSRDAGSDRCTDLIGGAGRVRYAMELRRPGIPSSPLLRGTGGLPGSVGVRVHHIRTGSAGAISAPILLPPHMGSPRHARVKRPYRPQAMPGGSHCPFHSDLSLAAR